MALEIEGLKERSFHQRLQEKEDDLVERIRHLEKENREFERIIQDLRGIGVLGGWGICTSETMLTTS